MRRDEWGWTAFGFLLFYVGMVFVAMVKGPRNSGLPHWSIANFIDAQWWAVPVTLGMAIWVAVKMRKDK